MSRAWHRVPAGPQPIEVGADGFAAELLDLDAADSAATAATVIAFMVFSPCAPSDGPVLLPEAVAAPTEPSALKAKGRLAVVRREERIGDDPVERAGRAIDHHHRARLAGGLDLELSLPAYCFRSSPVALLWTKESPS